MDIIEYFGLAIGCSFLLGILLLGLNCIRDSVVSSNAASKIQEDFYLQVAKAKANRSSLPPKQETPHKVFKKPSEDSIVVGPDVSCVDEDDEPTGRFFRQDLSLPEK